MDDKLRDQENAERCECKVKKDRLFDGASVVLCDYHRHMPDLREAAEKAAVTLEALSAQADVISEWHGLVDAINLVKGEQSNEVPAGSPSSL